MALPAATDFTGSSITEAQFKTAMASLIEYLEDLETITPGLVAYFPQSSAPDGWLKANGAAVSRTTYAALFTAIGTTFGVGDGSTTFTLPDLRGEFLRALDDGRGVDSARVLGSAQSDQNKSHSHTINSAGDHAHSIYAVSSGSSSTHRISKIVTGEPSLPAAMSGVMTAEGGHTHTESTNGGAEVLVRNIALLACIKY